jgi:hypothetical protein
MAERLLVGVHILAVHVQGLLDARFLALVGRDGGHVGGGRGFRVVHDVFHAAQGGADQALEQVGPVPDGVVGSQDSLGHALEAIGLDDVDLGAGIGGADDPVRHPGHRLRLARREDLPDAGRTGGLDLRIALAQVDGLQVAQQRVIGGVGVGHHGDGLALQVPERLDAAVLVHADHGQRTGAQHGDRLDRHAVGAHDDRRVADRAADHGVARADLLGDVDAAAGGNERDLQVLRGVIALLLRHHPGGEGQRVRRRRQQVGDFFHRRQRRGGDRHREGRRTADGGEDFLHAHFDSR